MADILHPVRLGHSNIQVSPLCLGGMSFGKPSPKFHQWTIGPKETEEVIGYAFDRGINFSIPQTDTRLAPVKNTLARQLRICTFPVNSLF